MIEQLLVICGPGGSGKGSVCRRLLERNPGLTTTRSWTTRPPRESDPIDAYVYVDDAQFNKLASEGGFLEWVEFDNNLYGTPKSQVVPEIGRIVLEVDVVGAAQLKQLGRPLIVFLNVPDDLLEQRLLKRGETAEFTDRRVQLAANERLMAARLGATVVESLEVERSCKKIEALLAVHVGDR